MQNPLLCSLKLYEVIVLLTLTKIIAVTELYRIVCVFTLFIIASQSNVLQHVHVNLGIPFYNHTLEPDLFPK